MVEVQEADWAVTVTETLQRDASDTRIVCNSFTVDRSILDDISWTALDSAGLSSTIALGEEQAMFQSAEKMFGLRQIYAHPALFRDMPDGYAYRFTVPLSGQPGVRQEARRVAFGNIERMAAAFVEANERLTPYGFDDRLELTQAVLDFPLPVYGSPPSMWETLASKWMDRGTTPSILGFVGAHAMYNDRPVLAVITWAAAYVVYMLKPTASILRRSLAARTAEALKVDVRREDEG
jgi:hypothetical protein